VELIASAPGKVFVIGEYGVVDAGPALVATVTRRLRARVRAGQGQGELVVRMRDGTVRRSLAAERVDDVPAEARFVAAAAMVSARAYGLSATDLEVSTESDLDAGHAKTGLGGSAAVTAATVAAVRRIATGREPDADGERTQVATAVYAHRLAQGGGSGADVIAASAGGLVWLDGLDGGDVPNTVAAATTRASAASLAWGRVALPGTLCLEVVATGRACATAPRVARYRAAGSGWSASGVRAWRAGMRAASEAFRDGCANGDGDRVLRAMGLAAQLLSRLGAVATVPVYTAELRRACAAASTLPRTAAKPSGAGGGDCAVALTPLATRATLRARWRASGLLPLEVELEPRGAACEVVT
jgi:phosphomevalonate kinase